MEHLQNCTWPQATVIISLALIVLMAFLCFLCIIADRPFPWQRNR